MSRRAGSDPLADLARIMGQDDGYADLLKSVARTRGLTAEPAAVADGADEIAIPAMPLRAPAADEQGIDWEDLEAELAKHRQAAEASAADEFPMDDLRGSHEAWPGEAAAADDLERRLAAEFERSFDEGEPSRDGHGLHLAAGAAAVAGAAGLAYAARRQPRDQDHSPQPQVSAADVDTYGYADEAPPRRRRAGLTAVAAVLALAAVGGGGVYAYRAMSGAGPAGEPRVVRADTSPVRVAVQQAQEAKPVADRVAGGERVVTREERPVSVREQAAQVQVPPTPARVIPLAQSQAAAPGVVTDPGQPPVRAVNAVPVAAAMPAAAAPTPAPIQARVPEEPRRVRTVQVGPDGSILTPSQSAPARPAAAAAVPQQQALSVVPVAAPAAPNLAAAESRPAPVPPPRPVQTVRVARVEPAQPTSVEPARAAARPTPAAAPTQAQPLDLGPQRTASVRTAATAGGGTFVQISSHQSDAEARSAFAVASRRYPLLQGQTPNIRTAEIPGRGTWHRLRVGPFSREEAQGFCQRLKAAGGSCVLN
ncbi:SPOR domain-containing protein [Phreatobacter cathodiphilus]|uniref:SPOR domain-containing protein n=1 Tax=Phreatobacter cathodiphilus TaxID=1868589 RepID=UPI0011B24584|nr:SPOR domain-containing protein [Phreatobacter cathodiphilus]